MLITRKEYDQMITHYPNFMREEWPKIQHTWDLNGATVKDATAAALIRKKLNCLTSIKTLLR